MHHLLDHHLLVVSLPAAPDLNKSLVEQLAGDLTPESGRRVQKSLFQLLEEYGGAEPSTVGAVSHVW